MAPSGFLHRNEEKLPNSIVGRPSDNKIREISHCAAPILRKVVNNMQNRNLLRKIMSQAINQE